MIYKKLQFKKPKNRPFFYTSFVQTIDGKVFVKKDGYWPIGSERDIKHFIFLRAHADAIIDGKNTALVFGQRTINRIHNPKFIKIRKALKKDKKPEYIVLASSNDSTLQKALENKYKFDATIITTKDLHVLTTYLQKKNHKTVFIDGGPTLLRSFLAKNLIDEIFITIAPKIVAGRENTLTMVEGELFKPNKIKNFNLISVKKVKNEVFLRYRASNSIQSAGYG